MSSKYTWRNILLTCLALSAVGLAGYLLKPSITRHKASIESVVLDRIASAFIRHSETNHGRYPTNWLQIAEQMKSTDYPLTMLNVKLSGKCPAFPLQEHYVFVDGLLPPLGSRKDRILLLRRTPVKSDIGKGRYAITWDEDWGLRRNWFMEKDIQALLTRAGVKLPEPDAEARRMADEARKALAEHVAGR